jgi:hypothetical protein
MAHVTDRDVRRPIVVVVTTAVAASETQLLSYFCFLMKYGMVQSVFQDSYASAPESYFQTTLHSVFREYVFHHVRNSMLHSVVVGWVPIKNRRCV